MALSESKYSVVVAGQNQFWPSPVEVQLHLKAKIFILDKRLKHSHIDNCCTQAGEVQDRKTNVKPTLIHMTVRVTQSDTSCLTVCTIQRQGLPDHNCKTIVKCKTVARLEPLNMSDMWPNL